MKKQEEIRLRNKLHHEDSLKKLNSEGSKAKLKEQLINETRARFERNTAEHLEELRKKISSIDFRTRLKKEKNEIEVKKKFNDFSMRMEDNHDKVVRIDKIHEYIKEKKLDEYNDRAKRIELLQ